ncbi:MAG: FAD-dependent oxidoreductase, partial [Clostridium sp.]|nr:FAD-dependent oxidoreductase [Clostridium sp.]
WNAEVVHVLGDNKIEKIIIRDRNTDEESEIHADGIFAYVGYAPKTDLFSEYIKLTENGYIETDDNMMTNISGVFAAGDVRQKEIRQLTTAVSDGTIAAIMSEKYILGGK